jgi:predicted AlkP superfamily phosphohydrolase/phosphomutase
MYKLPANYPPSPSDNDDVCCLAGMGVPDAMGQLGTYQQFSTKPRQESRGWDGYRLPLRHDASLDAFVGTLYGPTNEFRRSTPQMTIELRVYPDARNDVAKVVYVNESPTGNETVEIVLNAGQWSDWSTIKFLKTPVGPTFETMARFSIQRVRPEVELYVTPLNFIPTASPVVFSDPPSFQKEIGKAIGPYHTQGFAEAFNARKHKLLSDEEYRVQAGTVLDESERMLDYALERYVDGLLFFYFSSTDLQAHIFWWDSDEKHPVRSAADAKKYEGVLEDVYVRMDRALSKCVERLGPEATVIVMSDHGFCNFKRCVGLCTWLREEGYLYARRSSVIDADWTRTRAYGLGLNGLYLNLMGRENYGIVDPSQRDALLKEITAKLLALKDPQTNQPVIRRVYRADEVYSGSEVKNAPDLLIGYERGYRASWATCLGEFDKEVITDNESAWSADHCIAHDIVPGIILSNRRIVADAPALIDLAPTILAEFGVAKPAQMVGRDLYEKGAERVSAR